MKKFLSACFVFVFIAGAVAQQRVVQISATDVIRALGFTPLDAGTLGRPLGPAALDSQGGLLNASLNGNVAGGARVALGLTACGTGATAVGSAQVAIVTPGTGAGTSCGPLTLPGIARYPLACIAGAAGAAQPVGVAAQPVSGSNSVTFVSATPFTLPFIVHCWG